VHALDLQPAAEIKEEEEEGGCEWNERACERTVAIDNKDDAFIIWCI
jgi:hypothetical protein